MPLMQSTPGPVTQIDGREFFYFVGTGYLGLQGHPEVIHAACQAAQQFGSGAANSRTAFGTTQPLLDVERRAAQLFDCHDAFYYASGWFGNAVLMQLFGNETDAIFADASSHYSLVEAAKATGRPCFRFAHRDVEDLQRQLKHHLQPNQRPTVLSDGVFAITGNIAPIPEYHRILQEYDGSVLLIDDAHGIGVLGKHGRGTLEHCGLWDCMPNSCMEPTRPTLRFTATLSKAIGGFGGIIPGSRECIDHIKKHSPYMAGASPPPPMVAAATAKAIELVMTQPELRTNLHANARMLKNGLRQAGLHVNDAPTPIVCLKIGSAENMQAIQNELMNRGIAIAYMPSYAGLDPEGALRIAVFATHTIPMIEHLLDALQQVI